MDTGEPIYAFTGMEEPPVAVDDDEVITVGQPIWDVVNVEAVGPLTIAVAFEDGVKGRVRFERSFLRGVFEKLGDPDYFARVGIANGTVSWPDEMPDLAPDAMHDELARNGEWILD